MMKKVLLTQCLIVLFTLGAFSQVETLSPAKISKQVAYTTTIPLSEMEIIPPKGRSDWANSVVPNKTHIPPNRGKSSAEQKNEIQDQALQKQYTSPGLSPDAIINNFDGISNTYGVAPPDTDGDVGLNHYIQMVNNGFQIFDKSGTALTSPADLSTIWTNLPGPWVGNYGDPIVLYDEIADRWLLTQFSLPGDFYLLLAVSETSDPLGAYHLYVYLFDYMPDYPKFGVWPDGYYCSINQFDNATGSWVWAGAGAVVFERDQMLNGDPADMIFFSFTAAQDPWSFLPSDFDGTPPADGEPNYFCYIDYWSGTDRLRIYEFETDWDVMTNSTFSGPTNVNVSSFAWNAVNVPQLGTAQTLDVLSNRLMYRLQYRKFDTHETMVTNHTVNAGSGRAGVRWYELRDDGTGWSMHQQGTYAPADDLYRWMGSAAMNGNGDIAIGYSVSSSTMNPAIRYTGRSAGDPLGEMTASEETIHAGTASQVGTLRWGDYSAMSVDPSDDNTFWYTQEYSSGSWNWKTRIASFNFAPPVLTAGFVSDVSTVLAGGAVTFTDMSLAEPTSWSWQFEGGTPSAFVGQSPPPITYATDGFFDVSLTVNNGAESNTLTETNFIHATNCSYCPSVYFNTSDDWISNVMFNTLDNSSNSVGYEDFTRLTTNVERNSTYGIDVTITVVGAWVQHCVVFFDWNQDCDFEDAGESFDLGETSGTGTLSTNVTVPADAVLGLTQMRVAEKWDANPGPCDNQTYGEVEDYTINVTGGLQDVALMAFLEGPFNGASMNANIVTVMPLDQPFNVAPWNYFGSESVGSIPNAGVTDWVLVEMREASAPSAATVATVLDRQAAFLLTDGSVVGLDGSSNIQLDMGASDNIYVLLWHRNHIPVLSNKALLPVGGNYVYDFTNRSDKAFANADAQNELVAGKWGLIAGDGNSDQTIGVEDKSPTWENSAGKEGYQSSDYNLDAQSNNIDKDDFWLPNVGKASQVPE